MTGIKRLRRFEDLMLTVFALAGTLMWGFLALTLVKGATPQ